MDFDDIIKGTEVNTSDIEQQETWNMMAKMYRQIYESFLNENFSILEAKQLAMSAYVSIILGQVGK